MSIVENETSTLKENRFIPLLEMVKTVPVLGVVAQLTIEQVDIWSNRDLSPEDIALELMSKVRFNEYASDTEKHNLLDRAEEILKKSTYSWKDEFLQNLRELRLKSKSTFSRQIAENLDFAMLQLFSRNNLSVEEAAQSGQFAQDMVFLLQIDEAEYRALSETEQLKFKEEVKVVLERNRGTEQLWRAQLRFMFPELKIHPHLQAVLDLQGQGFEALENDPNADMVIRNLFEHLQAESDQSHDSEIE